MVTLVGCSSIPDHKKIRAGDIREDFDQLRQSNPPSQPIAVRPSELPKIQRSARVLRIYRGKNSSQGTTVSHISQSSSQGSSSDKYSALVNDLSSLSESISQELYSLGTQKNQSQAASQTQAIPDDVLQENLDITDSGIALKSSASIFKTFHELLGAKHKGVYTISGLNVAVAIQQLASHADLNIAIPTSKETRTGTITKKVSASLGKVMDEMLSDNGLGLIWSSKKSRGWVVPFSSINEIDSRVANLSIKTKSSALRTDYSHLYNLIQKTQQLTFLKVNKSITDNQEKTFSDLAADTVAKLSVNTKTQASHTLSKFVTFNNPSRNTTLSNSITHGNAAVTETSCLQPNETVKVVKIFTAYNKPDEVKKSLSNNLSSLLKNPTPASTPSLTNLQSNDANSKVTDTPSTSTNSDCQAITQLSIEADNSGIIVTGRDTEISFINNLLDGVDSPKKQVLVEVYLVQVTTDWRRELASQGNLTFGDYRLSVADVAKGTLFKLNGLGAASVAGVLQALEQSEIGKTISSPSVLLLDGEKASVTRTRVLKYIEKTPAIASATDASVITQPQDKYVDLELKLTLNIEANVVPANNHVLLDFSLLEDTIDSESNPETQGQTKNDIKTKIETSPGDVVVLAGLYRQTQSNELDSLPGLGSLKDLNAVFGGASEKTNNQSELLIFIAPTVLEPGQVNAKTNSPT